jgi:hypothetical protein
VSAGADAIIASAQARGVPVISSRQLLDWLDARRDSSIAGLSWSGNTLSFTVDASTDANGLQAMLPLSAHGGTLTALTRGGSPVSFATKTIKGVAYAFFAADDGSYAAAYG